MTVSLALLKSQLNLVGPDDDALLMHKIEAAQGWIEAQIGTPLVDLDPYPATIDEAVLQLAAYWYEQREAALVGVSANEVPFGVRELIASSRIWEM